MHITTLPFGGWADFSVGVMNGQSIAGWDNFLGYNNGDNLIVAGTVGVNFLNKLPGRFRVEVTGMWGQIESLSSFNQENTTDVEESKGIGVRVLIDDPWWDRIHIDGAFNVSRYTNPNNPLLNQGVDVVPVVPETEYARYLDVSLDILKNLSITDTLQTNATFVFRHEKVNTLYQSLAAFVQPDLEYYTFELNGNIGEFFGQFLYYFSEDNLDNIPSILTTKNRRWFLTMSTPFAFLIGKSGSPSPWYPRLSYSMERTRQFGVLLDPQNSNFDSESQVPDQVSWNFTSNVDWTGDIWRFGYTFNLSTVDNRQPGREDSDFSTLVNGISLGISPFERLDLSLSAVVERGHDEELELNNYTQRYGAIMNFRTTERSVFTTNISQTFGDSSISQGRDTAINLQWSIDFELIKNLKSQFFVRYFYQRTRDENSDIGFNNKVMLWTLNAGLNLSFESL